MSPKAGTSTSFGERDIFDPARLRQRSIGKDPERESRV